MSSQTQAALIGGGLALSGALLVFIFTVIYTKIREARQRVRARMGYARLLDDEIEANGRALKRIEEQADLSWGDLSSMWLERPPTDEAWKEVREPLVPLINPEDFRKLGEHYRLLAILLDLKEHPRENPQPLAHLTVWGVASDLTDEVPHLREMLADYEKPAGRERWLGF